MSSPLALSHSSRLSRRFSLRLILAGIWLVFSLTLAGWWLIFGLSLISKISTLLNQPSEELSRSHRMLLSEGLFLFVLLLAGGLSLLYFIWIEMRQRRQIQEFFATFTHDLRTSIASLRLQAESLQEDFSDASEAQARLTKRLVKDTVRLELQLNNSLFIANPETAELLLENIKVSDLIRHLQHHWPDLRIEIQNDGEVVADMRALESILQNILQNAVVHGSATRAQINMEQVGDRRVCLRVSDNGRGFHGEVTKLGQVFVRHSSSSGSGIGLHLVSRLAHLLDGEVRFEALAQGFQVSVYLPGRVLT